MMDNSRIKIERIFSESVYDLYKQRKYGIKSCKCLIDPECAALLRDLYINRKERFDCDQDSSECCTYQQIKELVNTL